MDTKKLSTEAKQGKHTPTPWYIGESKGGASFVYSNESSQPLEPKIRLPKRASRVRKANAELIVRAVNSHSALVKALEAIVNNAEYQRGITYEVHTRDIERAEEALRNAKG